MPPKVLESRMIWTTLLWTDQTPPAPLREAAPQPRPAAHGGARGQRERVGQAPRLVWAAGSSWAEGSLSHAQTHLP